MAIIINENRTISKLQLQETLKELNLLTKFQKAKNIVIKPNLAAGGYVTGDSHVVSDLYFLQNFLENVYQLNPTAIIHIAESDSTGYGFAFLKFENLGFHKLSSEKVKLLDLSRDHLSKIENPAFKYYNTIDKQLWLSTTLVKSDFFISLANLKTHSITKFTGVCKNLFGLLPLMDKSILHPKIHEVVHDLVIATKPDLSITDGFVSMEGNGPVGGDKKIIKKRFFGNDPFELDCFCSDFICINYKTVGYLKLLESTFGQHNHVSTIKVRFKYPGKLLRINNYLGLKIQSFGHSVMQLGHRVHIAETPMQLMIAIFRPILLKFVSLATLKKLKKKLTNE